MYAGTINITTSTPCLFFLVPLGGAAWAILASSHRSIFKASPWTTLLALAVKPAFGVLLFAILGSLLNWIQIHTDFRLRHSGSCPFAQPPARAVLLSWIDIRGLGHILHSQRHLSLAPSIEKMPVSWCRNYTHIKGSCLWHVLVLRFY